MTVMIAPGAGGAYIKCSWLEQLLQRKHRTNFAIQIIAFHYARAGSPSSATTAKNGGYSWITALAFAFLTYSSGTAAYRSLHDPPAVVFVAATYVDLVLLLLCLRALDEPPAGAGGPRRGRLKAAVWALATLLTLMFSYRVSAVMPWPVAAAIWAAASAVAIGGFWALFIYEEAAPAPDGRGVDGKP